MTLSSAFVLVRLLWVLILQQYVEGNGENLCPLPNIALHKNATQSSVKFNGKAERAVDGNLNTHYSYGSCTHTEKEGDKWWGVDLGYIANISNVIITNRWNANSLAYQRLREFEICISNSTTNYLDDRSHCCNQTGYLGNGETRSYTFGYFGQIVLIRKHLVDQDALTLCEVQVLEGKDCSVVPTTKSTDPTQCPSTSSEPPTTTSTSSESHTMPFTSSETPFATSANSEPPTTNSTSSESPTMTSTSLESPTTTSASSEFITTTFTSSESPTTTSTSSELPSTASISRVPPSTRSESSSIIPTCACTCTGKTINIPQNAEELMEKIATLKAELIVDKKKTSSSKRKLISAPDDRKSSQSIGIVGILLLCVPVVVITVMDMSRVVSCWRNW